jgi:hypothetical protein
MGKHGRSARKTNQPQWQEDDFESLLPSSTRAGTALRPVTKVDVTEVDWVRQLWAPRKTKETTAQLSTNTNAAHAVANAAAEEADADATTHEPHDVTRIHAELKLEQLSIGTTAAQTTAIGGRRYDQQLARGKQAHATTAYSRKGCHSSCQSRRRRGRRHD